MMGKTIRVLSIDGGGTRGLMPATMLHQMEQHTGQSIADIFDVIVGSATGGIIATALSAGLPTNEIIDIYLNRASFILPDSFFRKVWNPLNLFAPKYPNDNLKELLEDKLGCAVTLGDVYTKYGRDTIFLVASLELSPELAPQEAPQFKVKVFNSADPGDHKEHLVDVALRTSAAAVNLPIHQKFGEGGNYANDPALMGLSFCLNQEAGFGLSADIEDVRVLSLGCGSDGGSYFSGKQIGKGNWGLIKWMGRLVNLVIDTNMVYTQYLMEEMLGAQAYLRVNPYYKSAEAPDILRKGKLRIDVKKPEQLQAIKAYAESIFQKEQKRMIEFLDLK